MFSERSHQTNYSLETLEALGKALYLDDNMGFATAATTLNAGAKLPLYAAEANPELPSYFDQVDREALIAMDAAIVAQAYATAAVGDIGRQWSQHPPSPEQIAEHQQLFEQVLDKLKAAGLYMQPEAATRERW